MSLDGKLGILIVTLAALFLIYLDNAGKLGPALALITGPVIADGPLQVANSQVAAAPVTVLPTITSGSNTSGTAPAPITVGGGSIHIGGINGPVLVPPAGNGPLPVIVN